MTRALRLLDLYCGAGGASAGYARAGFDVTGVDHIAQPDYPFTFHLADALDYVIRYGHRFDVIAASPPCQAYTTLRAVQNADYAARHPRLIAATRQALADTGRPYVIENVGGAMRELVAPVMLCGLSFALNVYRHRYFESPVPLTPPTRHLPHRYRVRGWRHGVMTTPDQSPIVSPNGHMDFPGDMGVWRSALGVEWITNRRGIVEAIPPAYTYWIGRQLRAAL